MKVTKMWLDGKPNQNPSGTTRANRNILINKSEQSITNEDGNVLVETYGERKDLIGVITLDSNDFIVFVKKADNHSEIGYVDSNLEYTTLISNGGLNFKYNSPIHGTFQRNANNELIVVFTDKEGRVRYFNKDKAIILDNLDVFPESKRPDIRSTIDLGGNLKAGAWYPVLEYQKDTLVTSTLIKDYNPVFITNVNIDGNSAASLSTGTIPNITTNKLIRLFITNLDTRYTKLRVGAVFQANGVRTYYYAKTINIISTTETVTISRMEELTVLASGDNFDEVILDKVKYKSAKHITQLEDTLYLTDLTKYEEPIQQSIVNKIGFNWTIPHLIDFGSTVRLDFKDNVYNNQIRHWQHGEVYAIFIAFEYNHSWGQWWHVPGRELTSNDRIDSIDGFKKYQTTDTCSIDGTLSAWENEDENYPDFDYYPTGKVRHIKFPSIKWMRENIYGGDDFYGSRKLDVLNLQISPNTFNLAEFKDVDGNSAINFKLGYAKRDTNSGLVVGQSIFVGSADFTGNSEVIYSSVGFNANITNYNPTALSTTNIRTYDFVELFNKTAFPVNYVRSEVILHANIDITNFKNDDLNYSDIRYGIANFYTGTSALTPRELTKVNKARFVINNTLLDNIDNRYLEDNINLDLTQSLFLPPLAVVGGNDWGTPVVYTHLLTLLDIKKNCYSEFYNQTIISCEENKFDNIKSYGGDTYFGLQSINTFGTNGRLTYGTDPATSEQNNVPQNGTRIANQFVAESRFNMSLRYVNPAIEGNTFYQPYSDATVYLPRMRRDREANLIAVGYNTDYNAQNDLAFSDVFNPNAELIFHDKFLVARGSPIATEINDISSWLNFKLNDVYHLNKTRGDVVVVFAGKDYLLFHHHNALFRTRVRTYIDTTGDTAFTGQGDIFANEPEEIIFDNNGALGTQHRWSCYMSKYGYFWIDSEAKKVYQYTGEIKQLSENGLVNFFQANSQCNDDNPFNSYGFNIVVDDYNDRLLLTKKNSTLREEYKKRFKGIWKNDKNFLNSLTKGDIVVKDGQHIVVN